ncbi:asparagine synthase-related protein [Nocardia xishanensis]
MDAGVALSGGLDSSAIAAVAARRCDAPLTTLSVRLSGAIHDETEMSRLVARSREPAHDRETAARRRMARTRPARRRPARPRAARAARGRHPATAQSAEIRLGGIRSGTRAPRPPRQRAFQHRDGRRIGALVVADAG